MADQPKVHPGLGPPLRVLAVVDRFDSLEPTPCAYIRIIEPLLQAARAHKLSFVLVDPALVCRYDADLVLVQRAALGSMEQAEKVIAHCRRYKIGLIYDLDDNFFALADMQIKNQKLRQQCALALRLVGAADEVWVSSRRIKLYLQHINPQIHVVENFVDVRLWRSELIRLPEVRQGGSRQILYMGTPTHRDDINMIIPVLRRIKRLHGEAVNICFMGGMPAEDDRAWMTRVHLPEGAHIYPVLCAWLGDQRQFDIGIAPLRVNEFNRCKSDVKYLDYSSMGLATVASNLEPYRDCIVHDVNGLLVGNSNQEWFSALDGLLRDDSRLLRLRKNALAFSHSEVRALQVLRVREARMSATMARQASHAGEPYKPKIIRRQSVVGKVNVLILTWQRLLDALAQGSGVRLQFSSGQTMEPAWARCLMEHTPRRLDSLAALRKIATGSLNSLVFYGGVFRSEMLPVKWLDLSRPLTSEGRIIFACPVEVMSLMFGQPDLGSNSIDFSELTVKLSDLVKAAGLRVELVAELEGAAAFVLMRITH